MRIEYDDGYYDGSVKDGQPNGYGVMVYDDGTEYSGEFKLGLPHGKGKLVNSDGSICEGEFFEGSLNGECRVVTSTGVIYEGEFVDDMLNGKGKIIYTTKEKIVGRMINNQPHGKCTRFFENGDVLEGEFVNGEVKEGNLQYANGHVYSGSFKNGVPHGKGSLTIDNDIEYEGEFVNGEFVYGTLDSNHNMTYEGTFKNYRLIGQGTASFIGAETTDVKGEFVDSDYTGNGLINLDTTVIYKGDLINGVPNGYGVLYLKDTERYEGNFVNGLYEGEGTTYKYKRIIYCGNHKNGKYHGKGILHKGTTTYDGEFQNGKKNGNFKITYKNNITVECEFENDVCKDDKKIVEDTYFYEGDTIGGIPHGYGFIRYDDGRIYEGYFSDGQLHGYGKYVCKEETYEGEFVRGSIKKGKLIKTDFEYEGTFKNNKLNGYGIARHRLGARYEGDFCDGYREGYGVEYNSKGQKVYEGEFERNKHSGQGILYRDNKKRYEGNFADNHFSQTGTYYFADGTSYQGQFMYSKNYRHGVLTLPDGKKISGDFFGGYYREKDTVYYVSSEKDEFIIYKGEFEDGKINGQGSKLFSNGRYEEGFFENNLLCGKGKIVINGTTYQGIFNKGVICDHQCIMTNEFGDRYEGEYSKLHISGKGKYTYANSTVIEDDNMHKAYFYGRYINTEDNSLGYFIDTQKTGIGPYFEIKDGQITEKLNGEYKLIFTNGSIYEGKLYQGQYTGKGRLESVENDLVYEGEFLNGLFDGKGECVFTATKQKYGGEFKDGEFHGYGRMIFEKTDYCKGYFGHGRAIYGIRYLNTLRVSEEMQKYVIMKEYKNIDGKEVLYYDFINERDAEIAKEESNKVFQGNCLATLPNGTTYEGRVVCVDREGRGPLMWLDTDNIENNSKKFGELIEGYCQITFDDHIKLNGYAKNGIISEGTKATPDGLIYNGEIKDNRAEGKGTLTVEGEDITLNGEFRDDNCHGKFHLHADENSDFRQIIDKDNEKIFGNIKLMEGFCEDAYFNGKIYITYHDGKKREFNMIDDEIDGIVTVTYPDGTVEYEYYIYDNEVDEKTYKEKRVG